VARCPRPHLHTADPSARVFHGHLSLYPSHDLDQDIPASPNADQFGMAPHQAIVEFQGRWCLFYHDSKRSGATHRRDMKVPGLTHRPDGTIETRDP